MEQVPRPGDVGDQLALSIWAMGKVSEMERGARLTVPCSFHVALDPLFNRGDIFLGVLEIFSNVGRLAARDEAVLGRLARLGVDGPATVLDACGEVVGATVSLGVLKVQVFRAGGGVVAKESVARVICQQEHEGRGMKANDDSRMLISDLSSIRIHTTSRLSGLDIAPDHGCHITLVVHEAGIEVWSFIGVGRDNVCAAAREGVFQEVEHAEKFALRHEHVISKEAASH